MTIALQDLNWISNVHGTRLKQRMCGVASVSMGFFYLHCHHLRHNDKSMFTEKLVQGDPWSSALPKEEMNGEEVWKMQRLKHILIHTAKERISEAVAGIVVFASVCSRSMDRDPILTPCDRSCGTCQIWPRRLAKLHAPCRNYTRDLGTQNR